MKVIDCFPYNGDSLALFRLAYLWDVVDEFIIVEAGETYSGQKKDFLFLDKNAALLKPFASKITRLVIERFPAPTDAQIAKLMRSDRETYPHAWFREKYQRNFATDYLNSQSGPWMLLACDVDEIPRRKFVARLSGNYEDFTDGCRLQMALFYYSSQWIKPNGWNHAFVINDRGARQQTLDDLRVGPFIRKVSGNAGWHLSYFMTREEIRRKVQSFSHQELNSATYYDLDWVQECIRTGKDLYRRGAENDCIRYDGDDLPDGLRAFERAHGIGAFEK